MQSTQEMLFRVLLDAIRESDGVSVTVEWDGTFWQIRFTREHDGKVYGNRLSVSPSDLAEWEPERLPSLVQTCVRAQICPT